MITYSASASPATASDASKIHMAMREKVLLRLLDLVMAECDGVTPMGKGKADFKGLEFTYGPIADEASISEKSGLDCDILIGKDSVDCFLKDDVVPFSHYFEQEGNERVESMLEYMCDLRRRGIRWSTS